MSWTSEAEREYALMCRGGLRGQEIEPDPVCQDIFGCTAPGTIKCDCGEWICAAHVVACPGCGIQTCRGGCSIHSTYDDARRCFACHHEHEAVVKAKGRAA
jgi:hypothetical protein